MRSGGRWAAGSVVGLVACLVVGTLGCAVSFGAAFASVAPFSLGSSVSLSGALVVPGAEELLGGEQARAQRQADLLNPTAVEERAASRTRFEHLDAHAAVSLAGKDFPGIVDRPAGGPPQLPTGERIVKYDSRNAAVIALPDGKHGVVESLGSMATPTGHGQFAPLNLTLRSTGSGYAPTNSDVAVQIPKHASGGVSMPSDGVSLTPVNAHGQLLGGSEGAREGASVVYANTQTDTDTLAKPTTGGFEIDSLLRSVDSPETLYFKVGMPAGATLVSDAGIQGNDGPGGARIVFAGRTIAAVAATSAQDATGTSVPVRMSVAGGTLVVSVPHSSREYAYPIAVDPQAYDSTLQLPSTEENNTETNWLYHEEPAGHFTHYTASGPVMGTQGGISEGEHDEFRYAAHGQASVGFIEEESSATSSEQSGAVTKLEFDGISTVENAWTLLGPPGEYKNVKASYGDLWDESEGHFRGYSTENLVRIMQTASKSAPEGYGFWFQLFNAMVGVNQQKGPEVSFNTFESIIGAGLQNVLTGGWLSEANGAVEIIATDPGLGVSNVKIIDLTAGPHSEHWVFKDPVYANHLCTGVWCAERFQTNGANGMYFTYNKEMGEGRNTVELCAENEALMKACTTTTVNVDNAPPREIKLSGLAETGAEISATQHQITVEATDGTAPTPSSGLKSLRALVDGKELGTSPGSCSPGPCTVTGTWTIDAESLGSGEHKLLLVATSNAGRGIEKTVTFAVRNATPVKVGPGTVDPVTGQFALSASDVNIAGAGSVSRAYRSRSLTAGVGGPLGPQWRLNAGSGMSIKIAPNGNAELTSASGGLTTFAKEGTKFRAPKGDENLVLEAYEKESGKGVTEYLLKVPTAGTTDRFIQPAGSWLWVPAVVEGPAPGHTIRYGYQVMEEPTEYPLSNEPWVMEPVGIAKGPDGNLWVAQMHLAVTKVTTEGTATEYPLHSPFQCAEKISPGPSSENALWFTDGCSTHVGRITTSGVATAYGVPTGTLPMGVGTGPDGNLWLAMWANGVGKMTTSGEITKYSTPVGSDVDDVTSGPDGNLWFTEMGSGKIGKMTTAGEIVKEYELPSGSYPTAITSGPDGNLWFTDQGTSKIGKITTAGALKEYALPSGSGPDSIASGPGGVLFFTDRETSSIGWITTAGVVKEVALPSGSEPDSIVEGPDGNMWYADHKVGFVGKLVPVVAPTEILAAPSAGVSCGNNPTEVNISELKAGCRALTFTYGNQNLAGEKSTEWGERADRLKRVSFNGDNPATQKIETVPVAEYTYDKMGRLRTERDPRIEKSSACGGSCSPLKTAYGYDVEGHVTALSPPGQQPWLMHYAAIVGDGSTGRLLSTTRMAASTATGNGTVPTNSVVPTLSSTSPVVGTTLSVSSNGTWSNSPLAYQYQWVDCNSAGAECAPIAGAVNQTYTPQARDAGDKLAAKVTALNSTGAVTATTATTGLVLLSAPTYSTSFTASLNNPQSVATTANGNLWVADYLNNRIVELSNSGAFTKTAGFGVTNDESKFQICTSSCRGGLSGSGQGQFYEPWGIAINQTTGNIYVGDQGNDRIEEFNEKAEFVRTFSHAGSGGGLLGMTAGVTIDQYGHVWVADYGNDLVQEFSETGAFMDQIGGAGSGNGQMFLPDGIAFSNGNLYVSEKGNNRVQEFSINGQYVNQWGKTGSGGEEYEFEAVDGVSVESATGDLYVPDCNKNVVKVFNPAGVYMTQFGAGGTGGGQFSCPVGVAFDNSRHIYVIDSNNNRVEQWTATYSTNSPVPAPPSLGANAVSTVEYRVPLSGSEGSGLQNLTKTAAAKWGQKNDLPEEATALFPPDEPQGWPASSYKRATLLYMDERARTTNTATPSGGISTVEYNSLNEVTRQLTATDRAIAMKETCESEIKCKSAEVAKNLSSEKIYNSEGTQVLETVGPEHKIKLSNGTEEETRDHQTFSYNEGQPSEETHNLVTKTKRWSETAAKTEVAVQIAHEYYSGQNNRGWQLRKSTSTTREWGASIATAITTYESGTGNPVETSTGKAVGGAGPTSDSSFGSDRGGHGKFNWPVGVAVDGKGNVWVADTYNNRVQEFSASGKYLSQFGTWGTGNGAMEYPKSIAVDGKGNVWIIDAGVDRVEEFSEAGAYIAKFGSEGTGNGQFKSPEGLALDSKGNVWVTDTGNNRVQEFTEAGAYVKQLGSEGTGNGQFKSPRRIASDSKGNLWVSDGGNDRVQEFNEAGTYLAQFGSVGTGNGQFYDPQALSVDGSGNVWVVDEENSRVQKFNEKREYVSQFGTKGAGNGQLKEPEGLALDSKGNVWVMDSGNSRAEEFSSAGAYIQQFGSYGTALGALSYPKGVALDAKGNAWVVDTYKARVVEFSPAGESVMAFGTEGTGVGQFKEPKGIAIDSKGNLWVVDQANDRVEEYDETGKYLREFGVWGSGNGQFKEPQGIALDKEGNVWVADTANFRIEEFSSTGTYLSKFGVEGTGNGQLKEPKNLVIDANGNIWVSDSWTSRVTEFTPTGGYIGQFGTYGSGAGQLHDAQGLAIDQAGNIWVADASNNRVEEFSAKGSYLGQFGTAGSGGGQMTEPHAIALDGNGHAWIADTNNNRIEKWTIATPHATQSIYYSAEANPAVPACGVHPEWASLPCETLPGAQPETSGPPPLPVTTTTYNMWDEPETVTEKIGSVTRTRKETYDGAGRVTSSEERSTSENAALPAVTDEYSSETGAMVKETETLEGKAKTIMSAYNTLGQLTSYTDAEGATTKYVYDVDGRVEEVNEPMGRQVYAYDTTTGFLTKLLDTAAGTFMATYGVSGEMLTEGYPNGMTAKYTYNAIGQSTNLEYEKTTHCSEKCVWFSDGEAFGANGETLSQTSTLASEAYSYNEEGQLTQTHETPVGGKGCITRAYGYDEEGERTSLTTREPNEKGECTSEGGLVEGHAYDAVGRLLDPGVTYDPLGNMTKIPAIDAGGQAITSTFYVDNQVATQEQSGKTVAYTYDPAGRTLLAKKGKSLTLSHYAGPGEAFTWACEEEEGKKECEEEKATKWTRNIPGIDGALDAIQTNGETPVLQLHDLEGNIVGTVADSEMVTGLLSTYHNTEFGVPGTSKPPRYAWLGAVWSESELETGVITQSGSTYVPQLARTAQTDVVEPPGAAPNGVMATEAYRPPELPWANQSGNEAAASTVAEQRALELEALEKQMDEQGEGVDPIAYYSAYQAEEKAKKLRGLKTLGEVADWVDAAGSVPIEFVEGLLYKHFGWSKLSAWLDRSASLLDKCAKDIKSGGTYNINHMECKFEDWNVEIKFFGVNIVTLPIVNFTKPANVYWCLSEGKWCSLIK